MTFEGREYTIEKKFRYGSCVPLCCCCRPDITVWENGKQIGSAELPCFPILCCKLQIVTYLGTGRSGSDKMFTIKRCAINCHCCLGKQCGCLSDVCGKLTFET